MPKFLNNLAEEIKLKYGNDLSRICIVFSTRRACLHFKKTLGMKFDKPVFSPDVFSLEDFFEQLSPYNSGGKLELIFHLFDIYRKLIDNIPFEEFYPWGEIILNDFDDIDKNLADASRLFRDLRNEKQITSLFDLQYEDYEHFQKFWKSFSNADLTNNQKDFLKFWQLLASLYTQLKKSLRDKHTAYPGMLQRDVYEQYINGKINIPWSKVIFAGLNFLNKVERNLIQNLLDKNLALFYFDADKYYVDNPEMEAGYFLRKNLKELKLKEPKWIGDTIKNLRQKNFRIIGAPLASGQAKALGELLQSHVKANPGGENDTVVVLPEEKLLQPVLNSIPPEVKEFNITMGYPVMYTQLFSLFNSLWSLHRNFKDNKFYHKDVISVLLHPFIVRLAPKQFRKAADEIRKNNLIYLSGTQICEERSDEAIPTIEAIIRTIFFFPSPVPSGPRSDTKDQCLKYVISVLRLIYDNFISKQPQRAEVEHFNAIASNLYRLDELMRKHEIDFDNDGFWKLFINMLRSLKINFIGEPLRGLQVMGLLETRNIDFKNVFILSLNEGIVPKGYSNGSLIPYALRKHFGLFTFEEEDAAAAYNFYRLLQKAENIYLVYNTEVNAFASGEKSRFLLQLENEILKDKAGEHKYLVRVNTLNPKIKPISFGKTGTVMEKLKKRDYLTPSWLKTYITCSLKFYFSYIEGLKEEEEIEDTFTPAEFGTILHLIMQDLYSDYKDKTINNDAIEKIQSKLEDEYDELFLNAVKKHHPHLDIIEGENLLHKLVIKKLAARILENDKNEIPFKIIGIEHPIISEIKFNGGTIKIRGTADRMEEKNGSVKILDYKTGKLNKGAVKTDIEKALGLYFSDAQYKDWFQVCLYAYLYSGINPNVEAGIYPVKSLGSGVLPAFDENIGREYLEKFGERVKKLLEEIYDPKIPFTQTTIKDNCNWCPFTGICYRD